MNKLLCFFLTVLLAASMTACQTEKEVQHKEETPAETTEVTPKKEESVKLGPGLSWTIGIEPVQDEVNWTVDGTTETYVRELTNPKYQGRAGGSEGNQAAADWLVEQFVRVGLKQLTTLDGWKQSYQTAVTAVIPGEAFLVASDGVETELKLGEDWVFRASPEAVEGTFSLSTDTALYKDGKAIWDAKADPKNALRKLCLTTGDVSRGISYTNASGNPSRIVVTDAVYGQLSKEDCKLRLRLPDAIDENGTADNVIGYLPGNDNAKAVVLGANFDASGQCGSLLMPGAYNNASGVATLIQTAEWLAQSDELPCDVIFAAFNTEDNRENGSSALSEHIDEQYEQVRMVNLKCIGWKGQPLTVYGKNSEVALRNSLAGGLGLQYADRDIGSDEKAFYKENMSAVLLFQDACLTDQEASSVLSSTSDTADNLDFAMLDDIAQKLAAWVIERGDEPLSAYVVYW